MSKPSRVSRCSILLLLGSHLGSIAISTLLLHNCVCACSKWGYNRVAQHIGREQVLSLILPVETDPDIVCQAVSGLLCFWFCQAFGSKRRGSAGSGQFCWGILRASAFESQLCEVASRRCGSYVSGFVLQFEALETACVNYLCSGACSMPGEGLYSLAKLGDHLGLSTLYNKAAEILIHKPWQGRIKLLGNLLGVPVFKHCQST